MKSADMTVGVSSHCHIPAEPSDAIWIPARLLWRKTMIVAVHRPGLKHLLVTAGGSAY